VKLAFPDSLFNNDELYLGVTIGTDSEMTPRKRLSAVPYAYNSEMLQGQYASSSSLGSDANLFALNQASSSAAYATRTALYVQRHKQDNDKDFLIRGSNDGINDVFSISRQGNIYTTGTLNVISTSTFADISLSGRVDSALLPYITYSYDLGSSSYRWRDVWASSTLSGNVGINTDSPNGLLDIQSDTTYSTGPASDITGSGTATANNNYSGLLPAEAFDNLTTIWEAWMSGNATSTNWLKYDLGSGNEATIVRYSLTMEDPWAVDYFVRDWNFQGSNDDINWDTLDHQEDYTWTQGQKRYFDISNSTAYRYYRIFTLDNNSVSYNYTSINEVELFPATDIPYSVIVDYDGNLTANASTTLNNLTLTGRVDSSLLPYITDTYYLGNASYRWKGLYADNVTTTNLAADYVTTTELWVNGVQITGAGSAPNWQQVTDVGATTTDWVWFAGATSSGDIRPSSTQMYDLGTTNYRWRDIWASSTLSGNVGINTDSPNGLLDIQAGTESVIVDYDGNLTANASTTLNNLTLSGRVDSSLLPYITDTYYLGNSTYRWLGLTVGNVSSTNIDASGYVSTTNLYIDGVLYTGSATADLQAVTDAGNTTDNSIIITSATPTHVGAISGAGSPNYLSDPRAVDIVGDYAYVVAYTDNALSIVDISDPTTPVRVGGVQGGGIDGPYDIKVRGDFAYVAEKTDGELSIFDISSSTNPTFVSSTTVGSDPYYLDVSGNYAYITNYGLGGVGVGSVSVVDISSSTNPVVVGVLADDGISVGTPIKLNGPHEIRVVGNYAYVAVVGDGSLTVIDVSDPTNPTQAAAYVDFAGMAGARYLDVIGNYVYLTSSNKGKLVIFNISDPATPAPVGSFTDDATTLMDSPRGITVAGNYAYIVSSATSSINVIDISDPTSPTYVAAAQDNSTIDTPHFNVPFTITQKGKYLYIASLGDDGLEIMEIPGLDSPSANIGSLFTESLEVLGDGVIGNNLFVNNGMYVGAGGLYSQGELSVYSTSTFSNIALSGRVNSNLLPYITDTYSLGNSSYRWKNLNVQNVSSTNIDALGYVSTTNLYIGGTPLDLSNYFAQNGNSWGATAVLGTNDSNSLSFETNNTTWATFASTGAFSLTGPQDTGVNASGYKFRISEYDNDDAAYTYPIYAVDENGGVDFYLRSRPSAASNMLAFFQGDVVIGNTTDATDHDLTVVGTGDAGINILADTNNSGEMDNPYIYFTQDGDTVQSVLGITGDSGYDPRGAAYTGALLNSFFLGQKQANPLQFGTGNAVRMTIDGTGNVGIGTNDPQFPLAISKTSADKDVLLIQEASGGAGNTANIAFKTNTGNGTDSIMARIRAYDQASWNSDLIFEVSGDSLQNTATTEAMRISYTGNVGIGDSTPASLLTVGNGDLFQVDSNGNIVKIRNITYSFPGAQGDPNTYLKNDGSGNLTWESVAGAGTPSWQEVTDVGADTTNWVSFYGASSTGNINPSVNNTYDLGTPSSSWRNLYVSSTAYITNIESENISTLNVSSTYIDASGYVSTTNLYSDTALITNVSTTNLYNSGVVSTTQLFVNGTEVTGIEAQDLQDVTDIGAVTDNWIQFAGATSTGDILPSDTLTYDLGSADNRWKDVWASSTRIGTSTWDLWQSNDGFVISTNNLADKYLTISNAGTLLPATGNTQDIGSYTAAWKNIYSSSTIYGYELNATATSTLANVVPHTSNSYNLGSMGLAWQDIYASGTIYGGDLNIYQEGYSFVGTFNTTGNTARDGVTVGDTLYMVDNSNINIYDVSDRENPSLLGSAAVTLGVKAVVQNDIAYIAAQGDGIKVVDVSNSAAPVQIGALDMTAAYCNSIVVKGDYAYLACNTDGVKIVDISTPASPTLLTTIDPGGYAFGVDTDGEFVYVANGVGSPDFYAIDISNQEDPFYAGGFDPGDDCERVAVRGNYAYVTEYNSGGFSIYDISDPANMSKVGSGATSGDGADIWIDDNTGYVWVTEGDAATSFGVWDVSNPASPQQIYTYDPAYSVSYLIPSQNGDYVYIGGNSADTNAYIFDTGLGVATMESLSVSGEAILSGLLTQKGIATPVVSGLGEGRLYFDSTDNKFYISENGGSYTDLSLQGTTDRGNTTNNSIEITPGTIDFVSAIQDTAWGGSAVGLAGPTNVEVQGNYAYAVSNVDDSLSIIDISNPNEMELVGLVCDTASPSCPAANETATELDGPVSVAVRGNYAYVASLTDDAVSIIDVSDPTNPVEVKTIIDGSPYYLDQPRGITIQGNYLYVTTEYDDNLTIINISSSTNPIFTGMICDNSSPACPAQYETAASLNGAMEFAIDGDYAYVVGGNGSTDDGMDIIDISDPANPTLVGTIKDSAGATYMTDPFGVAVSGKYAYVTAQTDDSITVIDISSSTDPTEVSYICDNASPSCPVSAERAIAINDPLRMKIFGNYLAVTSYNDDAITIFDISSSTHLTQAGVFNDSGSSYLDAAYGLDVVGNTLYVTGYGNNSNGDALNIFNFSAIIAPSGYIGSLNAGQFTVQGNANFNDDVYVANNVFTGGDVTIQNKLNVMGNTIFNGVEYAWPDMDGTNGYVLTTDGNGNLTWGSNAASLQAVTDVGNTTDNAIYQTYATPTLVGLIRDDSQGGDADYLNDARIVKAVGNFAYVISYTDGALSSFDLSSSTNPVQLGTLLDGGSTLLANAEDMEIDGDYAYILSEESSLEIVDISDPYSMVHVGSLAVTGGTASAIAVGNGYAYLGKTGSADIYVVDVSDPTAPSYLTSYTASGSLHIDNPADLEIVGNYLYVAAAASNAVSILDVSNPSIPTETDYITDGTLLLNPRDLTVNKDYIYVTALTSNCMVVINKYDPTNMVLDGSICESANTAYYELDGAAAIAYAGNYVYVYGSTDKGIAVIDVTSSTAPTYVASLPDTASTYLDGTDVSGLDITDSGLLLQSDNIGDTLHVFETTRFVSPAAIFGTLSTQNFENTTEAKFYGKVSIFGPLEINNITYQFPGIDGYDGDVLVTDGDGNLTWGVYDTLGLNSITIDSVICDDGSPTCSVPQEEASVMDGATDVFVRDDYAYVAGSIEDSIEILDISDSSNPEPLGTITDATQLNDPQALFVNGDYAYVVGASSDFTIVDITNNISPTVVSNIDNATYFSSSTSIYIAGKYAYITASASNRLTIVEISDPNNPFIVGSLAGLDGAWEVEVAGNYAYVTESVGDKLTVIDISDPTNPTELGSIADGVGTHLDGARGLDVVGIYAYVTGYDDSGISIINISSSTNPVEVGYLDDNTDGSRLTNASDIMVSGNYAYVTAYGDDGVDVLNISSSTNPVHVTASADLTSTLDGPEKIYAANGKIYATGKISDSLVIFNVPTFTAPSARIGDLAATNFTVYNEAYFNDDVYINGSLHTMDIYGDTVNGSNLFARNNIYASGTVVSNNMWTEKMDAANPNTASVTEVSNINLGAACHGGSVLVGNYYYYVCGGNAARVLIAVDVSNPESPQIVYWSNPLNSYTYSLKSKGKYLYAGDGNGDIIVVDISIPATPAVVNVIDAGGSTPTFHDLAGNYLYYADPGSGNLEIYDVSDPVTAGNTPVGSVSTQGASPRNVVVQGDYAYISNYNNTDPTISVINISDPTNPAFVATTTVANYPTGIAIEGRYLYVTHHNVTDFEIIDVKDPTNPTVVKTFNWGGYIDANYQQKIVVQGKYVYALRQSNNAAIIDVSSSTNPVIVATPYFGGNGIGGLAVSGRYIYMDNYTGSAFRIFDMGGIEANGLVADSARFGDLQVLGNGFVGQSLNVLGGLQVGNPGISSIGKISTNGDLEVAENATIDGTLTVNSTSTMHDVQPATNNTYDLGTPSLSWRNIYASGTAYLGGLNLAGEFTQRFAPNTVLDSYGPVGLGGTGYDIAIQGRYAYVNRSAYFLQVYDIENSTSPVLVSQIQYDPTNSYVNHLEVQGDFVYAVGSNANKFFIVDVSDPANPAFRGSLTGFNSSVYDVKVRGSYAYVSEGAAVYDLNVIDITDPDNPVRVKRLSLSTGANWSHLYIDGSYAYMVANDSSRFAIVDITDPLHPVEKYNGTTNITSPSEIQVKGRYAYMGNGSSLRIFDIASSTNPFMVKSVASTYTIYSLRVEGDYVYAGHNQGRYSIFNVKDVANAFKITEQQIDAITETINAMDITGKYAYLLGNTNLRVLDLKGAEFTSLTAHDAEVGSLNVLTNGIINNNLNVRGGLAVGSGGMYTNGTLNVFSTTTLGFLEPRSHNTFDIGSSNNAWRNIYSTGTIYAADINATQNITNLPLPGESFDLVYSEVTNSGSGSNVIVQDKYMYTANSASYDVRVNIWDISDPGNTQIVTSSIIILPHAAYIQVTSLDVSNGYMYIGSNNDTRLIIVDVRDPANPVLAKSQNLSGGLTGDWVRVQNNYAYVTGYKGGLTGMDIYDVREPENPILKGSYTTTTYRGENVVISGDKAFIGIVGTPDAIDIVDISDPSNPTEIGSYIFSNDANPFEVYVQGNYLYAVGTDLYIFDISDAANPVLVSTYASYQSMTFGGATMEVDGRYAYISTSNIVEVVDISSSTNPTHVTDLTPGANVTRGVTVQGKYVYIANSGAPNPDQIHIYEKKGATIDGLIAHSAELGDLSVRTSADIFGNLTAHSNLNVGPGGIYSNGGLAVLATTTLSDLEISGRVNSDWLPYIDNTYDLGNATYRWRNLQAVNATFTTLYVSNPAKTNAFLQNGNEFGETAVLGTNDNFNLNIETNGETRVILDTSGNFYPTSTNSQDLGLTTNRWDDIWGATLHVGTSTWDISQTPSGDFTVAKNGRNYINIWDDNDNLLFGYRSGLGLTTGQNNVGYGTYSLVSNVTGSDNTAIGAYALANDGSGGSFSNNTAVGSNSMGNIDTGSYNTGLGAYSLRSLSGGASNTAVGFESMYSNTTGFYNTAVGNQSLYSNATGTINTAFGALALFSNQGGSFNTAIGPGTLYNNISGDDNIAIGFGALYDNLASDNIAIGKASVENNTIGTFNIGLGTSALEQNLEGSNNIAIGHNSLLNNVNADGNLAIGDDTLQANVDGEGNIAIGFSSLYDNVSGDQNLAIGLQALQNSTSSYNIAIGEAASRYNVTGQYNLGIGFNSSYNNVAGHNNVALGYDSLYGTFDESNSYNTAIGNKSLFSITTGASNTAVGYGSLYSNTTGYNNTAIGNSALYRNTTGFWNVAIGYNAMDWATSTIASIAIGPNAGKYNYNSSIVAIGYQALENNNYALDNVGVGTFALRQNNGGNYNTALGNYSGSRLESDRNTAVGAFALYGGVDNATGRANTAVGAFSSFGITTGSTNTAIGVNSLYQNQTGE
jgi:hypothetical protein